MKIVRESINFKRLSDERAMRTHFGGFQNGQFVSNSTKNDIHNGVPVYLISNKRKDKFFEEHGYCFSSTKLGIIEGDCEDFLFQDMMWNKDWPQCSMHESGMATLSDKEYNYIIELTRDPENEEVYTKFIDWNKLKNPIKESVNFQRAKSDQEIKDILFGWQPGQLLVNKYTDIVYSYIQEEEMENRLVLVIGIGHIGRKKTASNPSGKVYFNLYKKNWVNLNPTMKRKSNLSPLSAEEMDLVKPTITPEYIEKIRSKLGITIKFQ